MVSWEKQQATIIHSPTGKYGIVADSSLCFVSQSTLQHVLSGRVTYLSFMYFQIRLSQLPFLLSHVTYFAYYATVLLVLHVDDVLDKFCKV